MPNNGNTLSRLVTKIEHASSLLESVADEVRSYGDDYSRVRKSGAAPVISARFVTIELAAVMTGFTPGAIRSKITKAVWLEGRQWVKRDGRV